MFCLKAEVSVVQVSGSHVTRVTQKPGRDPSTWTLVRREHKSEHHARGWGYVTSSFGKGTNQRRMRWAPVCQATSLA